ncbi:nuclear transport factor 2 family protein [Aquimarina longa]|uniref:nuclear transport factor 2 family protein n=1 Tax=Aquimarina longa TaxID=1080221 RepID=UPI000782545F|nr:nuclear transport factor 2 family protein [Aquimarina longa]
MHKILILVIIMLSYNVFSQKKEEKEVKQTILNFFEGFHTGDTVKIKTTIDRNIAVRTIIKTKEGKLKTVKSDIKKILTAIKNRPEDQKWDERLLAFRIEADSVIANAWTPYEFYINDTFSHCGVNIFQLFNDGNTWKIIAIADTRFKKGCK